MKFTAVIEQDSSGWYVGQVEELPAAISQGQTIEETKTNLLDALQMVLEVNRETTKKAYPGRAVIREELEVAS